MTCIVGLVSDGRVWIGGDSAGVSGCSLCIRADPKVFRNGPFLIGITSSFRMGQLLRFSLQPPDRDPAIDCYEYMVTRFVPAVRQCLKDGGYARKDNEQESAGTFLVGFEGRLHAVFDDYQVAEMQDGFASVGSGSDVALGALYVTRGDSPEARVRGALEAAERFITNVRGPFVVEVAP